MTRWRTGLLLLVALLLVLPAAPAGAWPWDDEPDNGSDPTRPVTWGRTASTDHTLRQGCAHYRYRYRITAPTDEWSAELFLRNPKGRNVGSAFYLTPEDADRGVGTWKLCRTSAPAGRYTIRMRVTWEDLGDQTVGWVRNSTFRMVRP